MDAEKTNHFISLGLTEYESKAILELTQKGSLEAPEISRNSTIPKTRVYDVLEKLESKGLVISLEGRPKKYQAIETEKIIEKLIDLKKQEFNSIEKNAVKLKEMLNSEEITEEKENILKIKHLNDFDRILGQEILKAKKSIIGFTEIKEKKELKQALIKAVEKNVSVKLISNKKEIESIKEIAIKNSVHSLNAFVIDEKKVVLGLDNFNEKKPNYHFAILHNKSLAKAITSHFNEKWESAL